MEVAEAIEALRKTVQQLEERVREQDRVLGIIMCPTADLGAQRRRMLRIAAGAKVKSWFRDTYTNLMPVLEDEDNAGAEFNQAYDAFVKANKELVESTRAAGEAVDRLATEMSKAPKDGT